MLNLYKGLKNSEIYKPIIEDMLIKKKHIKSDKTLDELIATIGADYKWDPPVMQKIPKPDGVHFRDIFMFNDEDALIQKVCNKLLYDAYNKDVSEHVFSYRKGIRTYNAAVYVQKRIQDGDLYGYKLDISNYFMSIDPNTIHSAIDKLITDDIGKQLLHNLFNINHYIYNGEVFEGALGIMPGCALSSFLANYLLKDLDAIISQNSVIYARYSDDLLFMCDTQKESDSLLETIKYKLKGYNLVINPNKISNLSSDEVIDFLGLKISKEEIDINEDTFKNTKKLIKEITKRYRKKCELSKYKNNRYYTKLAISKLNKVLYKSILTNEQEHKSGRMSYIFANITTIKTLLQLEFYMKDSIRYVFTGKHNKANCCKLNDDDLEELGYKSIISLYNLYKLNRDLYKNEVYLLGKPIKSRESFYQPKVLIKESGKIFKRFKYRGSFADIYRNVINKGYFYFKGIQVYAECIDINLLSREIRFQDILIAKGDTFLLDEIKCNICGQDLLLQIENHTVSDYTDRDPNNLIREYANYAFTENFGVKESKVYTGIPKYNLFRRYSINYIANLYPYVDSLNINQNIEVREGLFLMYMYGHLCSNVLWDKINYNHKLCKYTQHGLTIVIPQELLRRGQYV